VAVNEWEPTSTMLERARAVTRRLRISSEPHWREARHELEARGITPQDAVLTEWQAEGQNLMCGIVVTRDGRLFDFCATFGYDRDGHPVEGLGWMHPWREIAQERVGLTKFGYPNIWAYALHVARMIFDCGGEAGSLD
jgi:hypothetical protein